MALTTSKFSEERWNAEVLMQLEDNLIAEKIAKAPMSRQDGDTMYFQSFQVSDTIGTDDQSITYNDVYKDEIPLLINKTATHGFQVKDKDALMGGFKIQGSVFKDHMYYMQKQIDTNILGLYSKALAANKIEDTTYDEATALGVFSLARANLENQNMFNDKGFILISPDIKRMLRNANVKWSILEGVNGSGTMLWTDECELDVYVTNNIPKTGSVFHCLYGSYSAIAFNKKVTPTQTIEKNSGKRITTLDDVIYYGYEVIRPKLLGYADITVAASTM